MLLDAQKAARKARFACGVRLTVAALIVLIVAGVASAGQDSVRVKAGSAPIHERERMGSQVLATVPAGTVLEVLRRDEGWFWVVLPADANGTRRVGYIEAFLVEVLTPSGVQASRPEAGIAGRSAVRSHVAPTPREPRLTFWLNGAFQPTTTHFTDSVVRPIYSEQATVASRYSTPRAGLIDVGGSVVLVSHFSLGIGFTRFLRRGDTTVTSDIPHPLVFNRPRHIQGDVTDLSRRETGVHLEIGWTIPIAQHLRLTLFGGPSLLRVQQDLVAGIQFSEAYPYDTAVFTGVDRTRATKAVIGYNVGGDFVIPIWRFAGVGGGVRYTRADAGLASPGSHLLKVRAGGVQAFAGLRVQF
jgi:hypothetical protein